MKWQYIKSCVNVRRNVNPLLKNKIMLTLNLNLIPLIIKLRHKSNLMMMTQFFSAFSSFFFPHWCNSFIYTRERACKMEWKDNLEFQWQIHKLKSKTVELSWIHRSTAHECMFYAHHFLFSLCSILYLMHSLKRRFYFGK